MEIIQEMKEFKKINHLEAKVNHTHKNQLKNIMTIKLLKKMIQNRMSKKIKFNS